MSVGVQRSMQDWSADAAEIRVIASSSMLALPLVDGANHLLGNKQMGLIHCQTSTAAREGAGRVHTYAHPNCEYLIAWFGVEDVVEASGAEVELQAGTGAAVTVDVTGDGTFGPIAFGWGAGDTDEEVTYTPTDCKIRWCMIFGLYRVRLDVSGGDLGVETQDSVSLGAGMRENNCIINGDGMADLEAQDEANRDALMYTIRQAVSWTNLGATTMNVVPGGAALHPMPLNFTWQHRARRLYGVANEKREYLCWVRSYFDGNPATDSFEWTLTAGSGDTVSSGALTDTAAAWVKGPTTLLLDATADDTIDLTFTSTDAAATCTVVDVSIYEYIVAPGLVPAPLFAYYGDTTGDSGAADRMGWPVDDLGAADLDWADGDGTAPDKGPSPLTAGGTPDAGQHTPWVDSAGADVTCTQFLDGENYTQATSIDPAADSDFVILMLLRPVIAGGGATSDLFSTLAVRGFRLRVTNIGLLTFYAVSAAGNVYINTSVRLGAWNLVGVTYDANGDTVLYVNGQSAASAASPGGTVGAAAGFGINSDPGGSNDGMTDIARVIYWKDGSAAVATAAWHASVAEAVLGMLPDTGTAGSTYARTTEACRYPVGTGTDRVHIIDANMPPAGNTEGLGSDELISTKVSKNYNLVAGDAAALTTTYASMAHDPLVAERDESVALGSHLRELGPYVLRIALPGGVD